MDIFGFDQQNWRDARDILIAQSFIRLGPISIDNERLVEPVADVYLEQAVPDFPIQGADITDEWFDLRESLVRHQDSAGLYNLGTTSAFKRADQKGLLKQKQFAETCYGAALQFYTQEHNPMEWAEVQINLGVVLGELADFAQGATSMLLLEQSGEAYQEALKVFTQEHYPVLWAVIQANLSGTLSNQADLVEGIACANLLRKAVEVCHAALPLCPQDLYPIFWSMIQNSLGTALRSQAHMTIGVARTKISSRLSKYLMQHCMHIHKNWLQ